MHNPEAHDMKLADAYLELQKAKLARKAAMSRIISKAGVAVRATKWNEEDIYHPFDVALGMVQDMIDQGQTDYYTPPSKLVEAYEDAELEVARKEMIVDDLEAQYEGWSRFFVVTSSAGHVHSSMYCHTCYATTQYGWMPELSGKTEEEAVALLGETLCSECFKSAPVNYQGKKITQKEAERLAFTTEGRERQAKEDAAKAAKAEEKAAKLIKSIERQHTLAIKVDMFFNKFGEDTSAAYRWTWQGEGSKGYATADQVYSDIVRKRQARRATAAV